MMRKILERLKSPVVWGAVLTAIYSQSLLLMDRDLTLKDIILSVVIVASSAFAAVNNPADRDEL